MKRLLVAIAILAFASTTALAHGGNYRGPIGEVPPNMRKPEDPPPPNGDNVPTPPPDDPDGTPTPDPNDPPSRGNPAPPGSDGGNRPPGRIDPPAAGPGSTGGTATGPGRRPNRRPPTFDSWLFWWAYNDDRILDLRRRLTDRDTVAVTDGSLVSVGDRHGRSKHAPQEPTDVAIRDRIIPALESALDADLDFDIRSAAVIALGKVGSSQPALARRIATRLIGIMNNESGREHFSVEESAALALGLLQTPDDEIVRALCERLLDRRRPNTRTRAFAALALGLLRVPSTAGSHDELVRTLRAVVSADDETHADVPVCALMAMGLSGDREFVDELVAMVRDGFAYRTRKLDDLKRSYAALAIGKIAVTDAAAATKDVIQVLRKAVITKGVHTNRSAVIALGQIGRRADLAADLRAKVVHQLAYLTREGETQTANFAAIGLGRIGAVADPSTRSRVFEALHRMMTKGSYTSRPFGALALGLMGRKRAEGDAILHDVVRKGFLEHRGDPRGRGAYAIALGMLGDRQAVPALRERLLDRGELKKLRGSCAVALGMIGARQAADDVRKVLVEEKDPDLRVDTTVAAGLIGGTQVLDDLVAILGDARSSLYVQGSITLALGRIGDRRAVEPLIAILENEKAPDLNRALAVVALGMIGDRNPVPILGRLSEDVNYRAQVNAVMEVLSIL